MPRLGEFLLEEFSGIHAGSDAVDDVNFFDERLFNNIGDQFERTMGLQKSVAF